AALQQHTLQRRRRSDRRQQAFIALEGRVGLRRAGLDLGQGVADQLLEGGQHLVKVERDAADVEAMGWFGGVATFRSGSGRDARAKGVQSGSADHWRTPMKNG